MKNFVISFFLVIIVYSCSFGQIVNNISYIPEFPQAGDTLTIFCDVQYPTIGCPLMYKNAYRGGTSIIGEALHCQDSIAIQTLCSIVDTFKIETHPTFTGTYTFYYMPGFYDESPCAYPTFPNGTPFPYPYVIGHIDIEVGSVSTKTLQEEQNQLKLFPNPANLSVILHCKGNGMVNYPVLIYDMTGKLIREINMNNPIEKVDVSGLDDGLYIVKLQTDKGIITEKLLIQH